MVIRKVYGILLLQLIATMGIVATFIFYDPAKQWIEDQQWVKIAAPICGGVIMLFLLCCRKIARKFPLNVILLGLYTAMEGVMIGVISIFFDGPVILAAVGITALIVLSLTIFAFQTTCDFTVIGTGLMIFSLVFIFFGIVVFFVEMKILHLIFGSLGVILFSIYLVFDTQLMMGGKHKTYTISPEDYIAAVVFLYVDIIELFIMILDIFGGSGDD